MTSLSGCDEVEWGGELPFETPFIDLADEMLAVRSCLGDSGIVTGSEGAYVGLNKLSAFTPFL